ncbi:MAG: hypothetical protein F4X82_02085 [Candidatus Spechtbacteria bacterium SB0662_bin_43]|uniref:Uncharacterized protein n=1 Tax=Candidatus Spechtbacteria bacterium SB0662_bin_43 TaxID=2604897 RepID=A0A845DAA2_9BACT|nr:hypothetical protein [Candidatus Spechtbacteria bacterium SB0662_bin_43]
MSFNLDAPTMDHFTTSPFVRDEDSGTVYSLHSEPNTDHGTKLVVALTTSELEECGVDLDSILLVNPEGLSLYYTTSDIGIWNCGDLP